MAITVYFSTGSKRENSTKQLAMTLHHDCVYKNGCDMLNPTLLLELDSEAFPSYTAFKIENRYFNVTDIRSVRDNLFEITGTVDVLATYKENILATTAYTIYDSVANSELVDNRLPMKTTKSVKASSVACPLEVDGGCYILSLTGSHGTTGIYKVSSTELAALIDDVSNIMDDFFVNGVPSPPVPPVPPTSGTIPDEIQFAGDMIKHFVESAKWIFDVIKTPISQFFGSGNIPENIRECKFIPFNRGTTLGQQTIYLGTYQTQTQLSKLNTNTIVDSESVNIPWQTQDFRRRSPFTDVYLYIPYIGMTKLSSENLIDQSSITVQYALCMRDGTMTVTVSTGSGSSIEILGQYSANVGTSVPIGISNINAIRTAQSVLEGARSIASENPIGLGMAALHFGDSLTPNFSCIGGLDGLASTAARQEITCYTVFHDTIVAPNSELQTIGSPAMKPQSLQNLHNYVQTLSASVEGAMTSTEREKLNRLLDGGIFIE